MFYGQSAERPNIPNWSLFLRSGGIGGLRSFRKNAEFKLPYRLPVNQFRISTELRA
jgi:hypothetical protein